VPYPHAGAHQRRNAVELADAGAARLVENEAFDGAALLAALDIVEAADTHLAMSAASRSMGRPGSADAVAELLLSLAEGRPLPDPGEVARIAAGPMRAAT
jgi:UDP-N-acetylglucosamine:LPS N-acetylglucosamine transferase